MPLSARPQAEERSSKRAWPADQGAAPSTQIGSRTVSAGTTSLSGQAASKSRSMGAHDIASAHGPVLQRRTPMKGSSRYFWARSAP